MRIRGLMVTIRDSSKKYIATDVASKPAKKATNVTLSVDVLKDARSLGINISQACDEFLRGLSGPGAFEETEAPSLFISGLDSI